MLWRSVITCACVYHILHLMSNNCIYIRNYLWNYIITCMYTKLTGWLVFWKNYTLSMMILSFHLFSLIPINAQLSPQNPITHVVTDMFSYYHLASTVVQHPVHKLLKAAYLFYCASTVVPMKDLIYDALIIARRVCTCTCVWSLYYWKTWYYDP